MTTVIYDYNDEFVYKLIKKEVSSLINDIIHYKIKSIYVTNKSELIRLSFKTLQNIFGTNNIIVINGNDTNNEEFEELNFTRLYIYQLKMYHDRRKRKFINVRFDLTLQIKNHLKIRQHY